MQRRGMAGAPGWRRYGNAAAVARSYYKTTQQSNKKHENVKLYQMTS